MSVMALLVLLLFQILKRRESLLDFKNLSFLNGATTLRITTFSINDILHNAECSILFIITLNVIRLYALTLS
jgi:hypothetical protein